MPWTVTVATEGVPLVTDYLMFGRDDLSRFDVVSATKAVEIETSLWTLEHSFLGT